MAMTTISSIVLYDDNGEAIAGYGDSPFVDVTYTDDAADFEWEFNADGTMSIRYLTRKEIAIREIKLQRFF